jgi:hypothetical protein
MSARFSSSSSSSSSFSFREHFARLCRENEKNLEKEESRLHRLTILAQHAYALSLGATVLDASSSGPLKEEEEGGEEPSRTRTYVAIPEERITTRFDVMLQAVDWSKRGKRCRKFVTFATFREETFHATSASSKIFDAKTAFAISGDTRNNDDEGSSYLPKSDGELHELFSECMFDPIYRAYGEAVATVPNRREPPSLRATPKELVERIFAKVRGVDLCALTATCKTFKAIIDGTNEKQQDKLFLNAIDREFPGIIREVEAMEVDAGRLVAGAVRAADTRTRGDFRPNGGEIIPKVEYKRLKQDQREREEARIREESMNRMRENMSFRGQGRGYGGRRGNNHRPSYPHHDIVPGFPGFVPGITGGAYDLYPNPDPTGGFNPLPPPGSIPGIGGPPQRPGRGRGHLFPDPGGGFEGFEGVPGGLPGGLPTPNGREPPDRFHTFGPPPPGGGPGGNTNRFGGPGGGPGGFGGASGGGFF